MPNDKNGKKAGFRSVVRCSIQLSYGCLLRRILSFPLKNLTFLYCLHGDEQNRIETRSPMANDSTGKSCPQYSVWKLLCQSPIEGQADLEIVENRSACSGKTAPGRLS